METTQDGTVGTTENVRAGLRTPTARQVAAVQNLVGNGGSRGAALIAAGYSAATAHTPDKVFGSPTVVSLMDSMGLSIENLTKAHRDLLNAYRPEQMSFPPLGDKPVRRWEKTIGKGKDAVKVSNVLTDDDIREFLEGTGYRVASIVHRKTERVAHYFVLDTRAVTNALDMAYKIRGAYAPTRVDKTEKCEGVWSLKDLRRKMEEHNIELIPPSD